ncbi:hypothetical protein Tco_0461435 [Tanacetum coccineum]
MASTSSNVNKASKISSEGGNKSLYEQWKEKHGEDPYDDDEFDDPGLIDAQTKFANAFDINLRGRLRAEVREEGIIQLGGGHYEKNEKFVLGVYVLDCCFKKMASDTSKFLIMIFDGKMDFRMWKMIIEDVLVQQGIDEALEEKQPAKMKGDVWKTMQKKDIWDKLTNIYALKSLTHRLFLKMELYSLKLEEGSNLNSFNQLVCQLANVDDAIKDEEQVLLMLSSLPKSYKPFVQTILTGRTTLTFEDVLKALRDNERMARSDSFSSSDKLLVADDSGRGRNFQRGSSKGCSKS